MSTSTAEGRKCGSSAAGALLELGDTQRWGATRIGMTLQEIDTALTAWNDRLAAVAENLLELQADPTYRLLTGSAGSPAQQISGVTAARIAPAVSSLQNLFQHFNLLQTTIAQASKLRANLPTVFGTEQRLREIEQLLSGPSITLPREGLPLEQRSLLSGTRTGSALRPNQLLELMTRAFATARDTVLSVSAAWNDLGAEVEHAEEQVRWLAAQPAVTRPGRRMELESAQHVLSTVRSRAETDPLDALSDLHARVQPVLSRLQQLVEADEQRRSRIVRGRTELESLVRLHSETLAAAEDARKKIQDCTALPALLPEDSITALGAWLDRLERKLGDDLEDAVLVGLRNWEKAAAEQAAQERNAAAAYRAPVEARNELRGRLNALKAKARAYGIAEISAVTEQAQRAETLLFARPTDMRQAAAAVAGYERCLRVSGKGAAKP